ncbi:homoserine dehydrogenase [Candidatus Methylomirabilis lanthanidiphila]|uniref:Homoserine dehydrogenase n=1 Tax=Candidatus Methylomirabilis lanthanidiphila TaxID=2211376 RepID=A0A564ZHQ0_9BACT|nr:homoserine dehydrogenase [Candidatus Methylomirabilis lanthanidiphila]VUZ84447.1 homoserine dehydrogenase [Candidatus Methylomirabilis lanthanidiphila]
MKSVQIGILGFGTVGSGVVKLIQENRALLEQRLGGQVVIRRIADTDIQRRRNVDVDQTILTTDAMAVLEDPKIDIIVELIGGYDVALRFCREALARNKHLVTANKALLSTHGLELYRTAAARRVSIGFEASVCGGIPLIRAMKEGLVADRVRSIVGIVNGTCNYILTTMTDSRRPFAEVLAEAQAHGYAEANPSLDVDGIDSAHKLQILATLAFGAYVPLDRIHVEGIRQIDASDIEYARELGYRIKLLAIAKQLNGELEARVHPALIPEDDLLASVGGVHNAVYVVGDAVGSLMFYGRGAGQMPTASAVVSDIVEIARGLLHDPSARGVPPPQISEAEAEVKEMATVRSCYYLRIMAIDKPGVLSRVTGILGSNNISIVSVIQKGRHEQSAVPIVILTHEAVEGDMQRSLRAIDQLDVVSEKTVCLRVEGVTD